LTAKAGECFGVESRRREGAKRSLLILIEMMKTPFLLRPYMNDDYAAVAEVYRDAVETLTRSAYNDEQVRMWASYPGSGDDFRQRLARGGVVVAELAGAVAAFGQLEPEDHVAFLYCKGAFARRGLASAIYAELEERALAEGAGELRTEASRVSRGFFARQGFAVVEVEHVDRAGVTFARFKMRKQLGGA
jgi:putative acetyltransferase